MAHRVLTVDLLELLPIRPGDLVLDLGCGGGRHIVGACHAPCQVVGVDIDLAPLRQAMASMEEQYEMRWAKGRAEFVLADARRLPFPDSVFDRIICSEVFEHISDDNTALREAVRILKPGGLLAVSHPRFLPEAIYWVLDRTYWDTPGGHVRVYHPGEVARKLTRAGLRPYAHRHCDAFWSLYWLSYCAVHPRIGEGATSRLLRPLAKLIQDYSLKPPPFFAQVEDALNPVMAKTCVIYARKPDQGLGAGG